MDKKTQGIIYAVLSALALGTGFVTIKMLLVFLPLASLLFWWFGSAALILFLIILVRPDIEFFAKIRKEWKTALVVAFLGVICAVMFFASLTMLESSLFAFIMRLATMTTLLLGVMLLKERFTKIEIVGAAIALIGTLLLTYSPGVGVSLSMLFGIMAAIVIGIQDFLWKVFVKNTHPITMNFYRTLAIAVSLLLYVQSTSSLVLVPKGQIVFLIFAVILSPVVGVALLIAAMSRLDVSKVVTIRNLEPFAVIIYAYAFFRTLPTPAEMLGGTFIVIGIGIMSFQHQIRSRVKGMLAEG